MAKHMPSSGLPAPGEVSYADDSEEPRKPHSWSRESFNAGNFTRRSSIGLPGVAKPVPREDGLYRSGKFGGGICADVARRLPWYASDWRDGFRSSKTITASLFMFAGCLAPGIAFGAFLNEKSGGQSGVVEYFMTQVR